MTVPVPVPVLRVEATLRAGVKRADGPPEAVITESGLQDLYRHRVDVVVHPAEGWPAALARRHAGSPLPEGTSP
jgi:hypothetical protein